MSGPVEPAVSLRRDGAVDSPVRVALIQAAPVFLNLEATVGRALELLDEAAGAGARVVVFPETWLPGYPVWIDSAPEAAIWNHPGAKALHRILARNALELGSEPFERLRAAARRTDTVVAIGAHERRGGTLYNTIVTFAPDGRYAVHRKLVPTYTERLVWGAGDGSTLAALETEHGVVGSLVCWEHWMPMARAVMHSQHETLHIAQWPWVRELHLLCSRHYAFEGQCFVAASGCVMSRGEMLEGFAASGSDEPEARALLESIPGDDDTLLLRGGSTLIAPDSSLLSEPAYDDPATVYGDLDLALIDEGRMLLDTDGHYSRPDVFKLQVDTAPRANVVGLGDGDGDGDGEGEHEGDGEGANEGGNEGGTVRGSDGDDEADTDR